MSLVSDIKLIRTDTTLDLSQKAEKENVSLLQHVGLSVRGHAKLFEAMVLVSVPGISFSNEPVFFRFLARGLIAVAAAWKALRMSLVRGNKENEALHTPR
ncbi:unnamed protein product [Sphagnum jensenii]|uniref:Uncharacterized protein n=1 Tax=Sphagnum jensenii TaxID=128206 RepID=A0ABP0X2J1_9BRYO